MSFFYLSPVKGHMPLYLLEKIVSERLAYLKTIFSLDSSVYNEYVIEGSLYDNVGHFMLCVVTILADSVGVTQFFLKSEIELFCKRLTVLSAYELRHFAKKILRSIKKYESAPYFIGPLKVLCQHLMIKDLAHHLFSSVHSDDCVVHSISLHFKHCLTLVAKRQVELCNGIVSLPCGKWKQYLTQLFTANLKYRINRTDLSSLKNDPRVTEIFSKLRKDIFPFMERSSYKGNLLLSRDVDNSSKHFPPCMLNLHRNLREKHRLTHSQRFYYSLFLKDIGMPVEEAIDFWRMEYRLSPNGHHSCSHYWEKDEKKYLYGIRHMYGLEGGRKNYTSVNCSRIQNSDTCCQEGGCPFKFDEPKLMKLLNCTDEILSQIMELKRRNRYTSACILYLNSVQQNVCDKTSFNFTPVTYYTISNKAFKNY